jgi:TetR/AcrR family transcriptional repressor of nem operon
MAAAVARRYGDRLLAAVAAQPNESVEDAIAAYRSAFREALDRDGRMCLGCVGGRSGSLAKARLEDLETKGSGWWVLTSEAMRVSRPCPT